MIPEESLLGKNHNFVTARIKSQQVSLMLSEIELLRSLEKE